MPKEEWRVGMLVVDLWVQVTKTSKSSSHLVGPMYSNLFISDLTFSISWIFFLCVGLIFFLLQAYILPSKWSHRKVFPFSSKTPRILFHYPGLSGLGSSLNQSLWISRNILVQPGGPGQGWEERRENGHHTWTMKRKGRELPKEK